MKFECGLIRDLMPLCADGIAGPESEAAVQAHLMECPNCAAEWDSIRNGGEFYPRKTVPAETKQYQQAAVRVRRQRRLTVTLASVFAALLAAAGVYLGVLRFCGARFRVQNAALAFMSGETEQLRVVGTAEVYDNEKQLVFVIAEGGEQKLWCIENKRERAFAGLWTAYSASAMPLNAEWMQNGISMPVTAYSDLQRNITAFWCADSEAESITLYADDGQETVQTLTVPVSESGLCVLRFDRLRREPVLTGYASDAAGRRILTLGEDGIWVQAES